MKKFMIFIYLLLSTYLVASPLHNKDGWYASASFIHGITVKDKVFFVQPTNELLGNSFSGESIEIGKMIFDPNTLYSYNLGMQFSKGKLGSFDENRLELVAKICSPEKDISDNTTYNFFLNTSFGGNFLQTKGHSVKTSTDAGQFDATMSITQSKWNTDHPTQALFDKDHYGISFSAGVGMMININNISIIPKYELHNRFVDLHWRYATKPDTEEHFKINQIEHDFGVELRYWF